MRHLSALQLLALWEHGLRQPPWQRALSLLNAAFPELPPETLASLSPGQRDGSLLALRENLFGPRLASVVSCRSCGERLELTFAVDDIRVNSMPVPEDPLACDAREALELTAEGYHVVFRLPNSLDLAEIAGISAPEQARRCLLTRCLLSVQENGETTTAGDLPETVIAAIAARMAAADPQGDVQISLTCPYCAHQWQAAFDPFSFLWAEIHAWAQHILREVHLLASAYGWREADILALSPRRRAAYLQMVMGST